MTFRGETVTMPELVALVEKHRGCYGNGEPTADGGFIEAWDEGGSPVGKVEQVSCGASCVSESHPNAASGEQLVEPGQRNSGASVRVGTPLDRKVQPAGIISAVPPASGAPLHSGDCAPVDVVLLASLHRKLLRFAFAIRPDNAPEDYRELVNGLDEIMGYVIYHRLFREFVEAQQSLNLADGAPQA